MVPGSSEFSAEQSYLQPPEDNTDLIHIVRGVIEAESGAIGYYNADHRVLRGPRSGHRGHGDHHPRATRRVTGGCSRASCGSSRRTSARASLSCDERPPDQARDVHLRHADALGDLGLGQVVLEAQLEDHLLALGQLAERRADGVPELHQLVAVVLGADACRPRCARRPRRGPSARRAGWASTRSRGPSPRAPRSRRQLGGVGHVARRRAPGRAWCRACRWSW